MKVLQVNNVYDFGSTGKITRDIHHGLIESGHDSVVYYGRRYKTNDKRVYKIWSEFYGKAQNGLYQICGIKYIICFANIFWNDKHDLKRDPANHPYSNRSYHHGY